MIFGLLGAIVGLVGWFGFKSVLLLVIGTVFYLIETIIEWKNLNAGAKMTDVIIIIIGCIIGLFIKTPWYVCGMIAINIYSAIMNILGSIISIKARKHH